MPSQKPTSDLSGQRKTAYKTDFKLADEEPRSKSKPRSKESDGPSQSSSEPKKASSSSSSSSSKKTSSDRTSVDADKQRRSSKYGDDVTEKVSSKTRSSHAADSEQSKEQQRRSKKSDDRHDLDTKHKSTSSSSSGSGSKNQSSSSSDKQRSSKRYDDEDDIGSSKSKHKTKASSSKFIEDDIAEESPADDNAYEDDFDDDFEEDDEEKEKKEKHVASAISTKETKSASSKSSGKSSSSNRGGSAGSTTEQEKTVSKSTSSSQQQQQPKQPRRVYDDDEDESRVVKANARVKIPTDSVQVFSSKIFYNHDSLDRQRRRALDLIKTIELDRKCISLLDINPGEMRTVYSSHLKHEKVQTNDDLLDIECQTDELELTNKWTQYPPDDLKGWGTDAHGANARFGGSGESNDFSDLFEKFRFETNLANLHSFLQKSSKVVEQLLVEKAAAAGGGADADNDAGQNAPNAMKKSDLEFSSGFVDFAIPKFLVESTNGQKSKQQQQQQQQHPPKHLRLVNACFSTNDPTHFVCSIDVYNQSQSEHTNSSILVVWNTNEPNTPYRILQTESQSKCLCYFSFIVLSGNVDGSISLWDLNESSHLHYLNSKNRLVNSTIYARLPTYSTASVLQNEGHLSEIKSIVTLQNQSRTVTKSRDVFMQLATLEYDCKIIIWTVVELKNVDLTIFETDLGLLPGGRIKLVKNSQISLNSFVRTDLGIVQYQTLCMTTSSLKTNDLYIATNIGQIIHINRRGNSHSSSLLKSDIENGAQVISCVCFHHQIDELFLAGYGSGEIRLYHTDYLTPIKRWLLGCSAGNSSIKQINWLPTRSSSFVVLDELDNLYMWDLLKDDSQPIFSKEINGLSRMFFYAADSTPSASETGSSKQSRVTRHFGLLMNGDNGSKMSIEIHSLNAGRDSGSSSDKELRKFNRIIKNYMTIF